MKKIIVATGILSMLLMGVNCEDEFPKEPTLPAETRTGQNTFGCYINGEVFLPRGTPFTSVGIEADYLDYDVFIDANYLNTKKIRIKVANVSGVGTYFLDNKAHFVYYIDHNTEDCYGVNNPSEQGTVEITRIDTDNRIISGRFHFTIVQPGCPDIVATEGRFDVKYPGL